MERKNIVGTRVWQARKAAKPPITQLDLVARLQLEGLSVDQSALSKIESGLRPVSDIEVIALYYEEVIKSLKFKRLTIRANEHLF